MTWIWASSAPAMLPKNEEKILVMLNKIIFTGMFDKKKRRFIVEGIEIDYNLVDVLWAYL